jgi:hypothetical protein
MKKIALSSLLPLVVAALLAAPAAAKDPEWLRVCGDGGACQTTTDRALLLRFLAGSGGGPVGTPPAPAPYLVLTMKDHGETWKAFYVPSAEAMAGVQADGITRWWTANDPDGALTKLTEGVPLIPAPELSGVRVGPAYVSGDLQDYLALFTTGETDIAHSQRSDWVPVDLYSNPGSPWTSSDRDLMFSPSSGLIERGTIQAQLAPNVARAVAAAQPLSLDDDGFAWATLAVVFAGLAAAILLALWLQRFRATPGRRPTTA